MENEEKASRLGSDDEFQRVLQVTKRLREEGCFYFIFAPGGGISASVDETVLPDHLKAADIDEQTFKRIFRREVTDLIFAVAADISDDGMVADPGPFGDFPKADKDLLVKRRTDVAEILDVENLREEFRAKMSACTQVLAEIEWRAFRGADVEPEATSRCAMAVIRISGELPVGPSMAGHTAWGGASLRRLLRPETASVTLTATLSDVQYLRGRLEKIERQLIALEEDEHAKGS